MTRRTVAVVAATGRLGSAVVHRLLQHDDIVVAIGRDPAKLSALPQTAQLRVADLEKPDTMKAALRGADIVVSCANAVFVPALLRQLPSSTQRVVVMGSTRRFSANPDATATAVKNAEQALSESGLPHVMLLSTMIYGAGGSVIDGWAQLIRRYPVLPVPVGSRIRVQPVHIEDVASAVIAATHNAAAPGTPIVVAGGESLSQHELIRRVARALKRSVLLVPVPAIVVESLAALASTTQRLESPAAAIKRLIEDRSFDLTDLRERLGVHPRALDLGFLQP